MTSEAHDSINACQIPDVDVVLHDEIKCRAYELYMQRDTLDGHDLRDTLKAELPRVLYAAAELEKYAHGEVGDTRAVRAARLYWGVLNSIIAERDGD